MKHTFPVTIILLLVFVASQLLGLGLLTAGITVTHDENGKPVVQHEDAAFAARPETTGFASFLYLLIGVAIATVAMLIIIRFRWFNLWKLWFFIAVTGAVTISLGALINEWVALGFAIVLAYWKIFRPNIYVHNVTEVLVYAGIALLLAPIFNLLYASLLLLAISVYDAYAVWRSKHMITMAKFQTESKLFAGLLVPYAGTTTAVAAPKTANVVRPKAVASKQKAESRTAILGGGDIAFPMIFIGVTLQWLLEQGLSKAQAFGYACIIIASATLALFLLFYYAKKDAFYPAMPFLSAGCFAGLGIVYLLL